MIAPGGMYVLDRGVHLLPFFGPKGEWQMVAVNSEGREVARASAHLPKAWRAHDRLWDTLYRVDPK